MRRHGSPQGQGGQDRHPPPGVHTSSAGLPTRPGKGERRGLDRTWLALLHRDGLAPYLETLPPAPEAIAVSIGEFNRGEYWRCHETLEALWLAESYPLRLFYQAMIKAAVGLLHQERHNRRGATAKFREAQYALVPFLPKTMGVDTTRLHQDISHRLTRLEVEGKVDWDSLDRMPRVQLGAG